MVRNIRIKKCEDELSIIDMDRGIIDKNGETGDVNNYDYMNTMEMCYSMCKLFLSGCLFLLRYKCIFWHSHGKEL